MDRMGVPDRNDDAAYDERLAEVTIGRPRQLSEGSNCATTARARAEVHAAVCGRQDRRHCRDHDPMTPPAGGTIRCGMTMKPSGPSESHPPSADRLVGSLDGPSRTIRVEPIETPVPAPQPSVDPEPVREPSREPERPREPAR
jgi:hypothetical protein